MATVNKNFKVKNGLIVEGDTATVNGSDIITEDIITSGTQTNITVTYDAVNKQLDFVAENGIADSTTNDLEEGSTNLYFTNQRALNATSSAYDPAGSAATAEYNAKGYADGLAINYDAAGSAASAQSAAQAYADGLAVNYDPAGSAATAESNANDYANGLAVNYDPSGSANTAESNANSYTDGEITTALTTAQGYATQALSDANAYTDNAVSGLTWKQSVNVLATADLPLTGSAPLTIDSHELDNGYRVLLTAQVTDMEDGIYDLAISGGSYTLTRAADSDTNDELIGASVYVMEGTQYGSTSWVQSNHYITGFAGQSWTQFSGQGTVTAGTGITVDGLEVSINRTTVDSWYDAAGSADTAEGNANDYTDSAITTEVSNRNTAIASAIDAVTTTDIEEGANLYFTNARAVTAIEAVTPSFVAVDVNDVVRQVAATTLIELASTAEVVYSFAKSVYRSAKFLVKVSHGSHTEVSEVIVTLDTADNVAITEYAIVGTNGSLGTITAISGASNVDLIVDAVNDNSTVTIYGTLLV